MTVEKILREHPGETCKSVHVKIGELTAVVPESLTFAYQALTEDTPLASSSLCIESLPILAKCRSCDTVFGIRDFEFLCPNCSSHEIDIQQGEELHIEKLELVS
ncbi:hydrogenase maturation nickel metallochaperone HypA [bacterium]|nr:hydrogenase maturation nickel metallochaperone HypA [bacterium]